MKNEIFVCDCQDPSHQFFISYDEDNMIEVNDDYSWPVELTISIKINMYLSFFKRIIRAFKYIFKLGVDNYDFDTIILKDSEVKRLKESLETYLSKERLNKK
jgi:hypothetical protein